MEKAMEKVMEAPLKVMDARNIKEFYNSLLEAPLVPATAPRAPAYESNRPPPKVPATAPRAPAYESNRPPPKPKSTKSKKPKYGWSSAEMAQGPVRGAGLMGHGAAVGVPVPTMAPPPPPPLPLLFEGYRSSLVQPSAAAMARLDRMVGEYYRQAMRESSAMDGPAMQLMGHVQHAVSELWGSYARIACFGSRATGLACATSDVDLVVTGMPGLDPATTPHLWRQAPASVEDQCAALEDLRPKILKLPGVLSATINRAAVPVLAITADVRFLQQLEPKPRSGAHDGARCNCTSAATAADAPTTAPESAPAAAPAAALLHLDISIHSERHRGLLAAQHIRWLCASLPPLAPLVIFLKGLLHKADLKSAFTGGLSSFALVLMVARFLIDRPMLRYTRWGGAVVGGAVVGAVEPTSFSAGCVAPDAALAALAAAATGSGEASRAGSTHAVVGGLDCASQEDAKPSLGTLLLEVLGFYGQIFDPKRHAILGGVGMGAIPPAGCGFALRRDIPCHIGLCHSPFAMQPRQPIHTDNPFDMQPLLCIDPVDSSNNAARACYRIAAVQKLFAQTAASAVTAAGASVASKNDVVGGGGFLAPIGADGEPVDLRGHADLALAETIISSCERLGECNLPKSWPKRPASA